MHSGLEAPVLQGRRIVLGITGSIAAFKAAELASMLTQAGVELDTVLTASAERFIQPLTFQALTGRTAHGSEHLWSEQAHILHVGLARHAQLLVIAPATADTLAKLAHGRADNLLTITALAATCPVLVAPAMDAGMYSHPATQANLETLQRRGVEIVGPVEGRMASGLVGMGRMVEPAELFGHVRRLLGRQGNLAGLRVVVSAGGTREPLDPVRVLANRSSGKQGFSMAQAALDHGAEVVLVTAPTWLPTPVGARRVEVGTAAEMGEEVLAASAEADALIMAAAVADFRPKAAEQHKIKKQSAPASVELEPTDDILRQVAKQRPKVVVGFAAESEQLEANARQKLESKGLDLIVANDITAPHAGFSADTNQVTILGRDGDAEHLPLMTKAEVAEIVVDRVAQLLGRVAAGGAEQGGEPTVVGGARD